MSSENLQITAGPGTREGTRILRLIGPLSMQTTFEFQKAVRAESSPLLIVDLGGVPYMDSAGLGVTEPGLYTSFTERVYITAIGCEI